MVSRLCFAIRFDPVLAAFLVSALAFGGCGPSPTREGRSESRSADAARSTEGAEASANGDEPGVGTLLVDMVVPRICDSLRGSFIGLPGEGGRTGPAAGLDPATGRWWIRECSATEHQGRLDLAIGGTGWIWTDRESMGFRVRQYLRFDANARFTATMEMAYDRPNRIVTVWMRPQGTVDATVTPRGLVEARATGPLSGMLGGLLELGGSSPNDQARRQAAEEGSQRLRERFGAGFTVTYAMAQEQMDFMVGALERGQLPERPYPPEPGVVWSINQRLAVWPGGIDVLGPVDVGRSQHTLDFHLEEGESATVDAVCARDFEAYYDRVLQGGSPPAPTGQRVVDIARAGQATRAVLPPLGCPMLLIVSTRPSATLPVLARTRVSEGALPAATSGTPVSAAASSAGQSTTSEPARPYRIRLAGMTIATSAPNGSRWDMIGGEPDPYVIVVSVPSAREVERTAVVADQHEISLDHWLPGAYHADDFPLRFSVYDDDVGADELIGVVELSREQVVLAGSNELRLELRTTEAIPRTTGVLRLTVSAVQ